MSRRLVATALVAASSLLPWMPVTHADAPASVDLPRATCDRRVNDDEGDAKVNYGVAAAPDQKVQPFDSTAALDIKNIDVRLTDTKLEVYLHLKDVVAKPASTDAAYFYEVKMSAAAPHTITFDYWQFNTDPPWNQSGTHPTVTVNPHAWVDSSTAANDLGSASMDPRVTDDYLVWRVDRAQLEAKFGEPFAEGYQLTAISAMTQQYGGPVAPHAADDTTGVTGDAATYTVGDDYCFGPPPAEWGDVLVPAVQYTDTSRIVATLQSDAGDALTGKTVQLTVTGEPGMPKSVETNADGDAIFNFVPTQGAGTYDVTLLFPGDTTDGKVKWTGKITVSKEGTKFNTLTYTKPSATARYVTATLLDNDNHAVTGQKVDWYVNGKKVTTLTTNSKGQTILKTAKPGQTVYAKFLGVTNKLIASTSKSTKLG